MLPSYLYNKIICLTYIFFPQYFFDLNYPKYFSNTSILNAFQEKYVNICIRWTPKAPSNQCLDPKKKNWGQAKNIYFFLQSKNTVYYEMFAKN